VNASHHRIISAFEVFSPDSETSHTDRFECINSVNCGIGAIAEEFVKRLYERNQLNSL